MPTENDGYDFEIEETISAGPSYESLEAAFTTGTEGTLKAWLGWNFPELVDYVDYLETPDFSGVQFAEAEYFHKQK